ncbi:phage tail protein [uncultured Clostridium sp.]|uniref:phage tail protein n=1 Tax=uncultured Clostridium sp. TaxID=59620 RepID=UPI00261D7BE8|nr:phage tail protein [uncultured Clostridium sp.]
MFKVFHKLNNEIICLSKIIKYQKNQADILTIALPFNSNYFNKLKKYLDYIKVINTKDNTTVFEGRVLSSQASMDSTGEFANVITCESVLNYFNDTNTGKWEYHPLEVPEKAPSYAIPNATVKMFLKDVLDNHNSKVSKEKQIFLGNIEFDDAVFIKVNFESSLSVIISRIVDRHNGYLIIRNENGLNYLDFLSESPIKKTHNISVGVNMDSININDSNTNIFTRVIPFGKNRIDITSVNNNLNFVEDADLIAKYGVIEKVMEWQDVTIPQNLLNKAKAIFTQVKIDADEIQLTSLDLSYINNNFESLKLYTPVRAINNALSYDNKHEIVSINLDLDYPFKSTFDLNNDATTSISCVSNVIEQTNSNKIEIVSIGSELETKVSGDSFESYKIQSADEIKNTVKSIDGNIQSVRDQTSTQIKDSVTNLNENIKSVREETASEISNKVSSETFNSSIVQLKDQITSTVKNSEDNTSSSIKELSNEISTKVSSDEVSSSFTEKMNEFDFKIGDTTPLSITKDELDMEFSNGAKCIISKDGFYYNADGSNHAYHSLYYHDSITKVRSGDSRTITVPQIFKGKDYKIAYWLGNILSENPTDCLNSYDVELLEDNRDNLTFTIKVSVMAFNPRIETSPYWRGYGNIVYTILA